MNPTSHTPETWPVRITRRLGWAVRDRWPDRPVVREVQGVRMILPWSHRLPDYARVVPKYGQNLVQLAELLGAEREPLTFLDVGANVGDSALQVLDVTDAKVLCVEADRYFLDYLHRNVDADSRVTVQESLLTTGTSDAPMAPVRVGGTTRFEPGVSDVTSGFLTTDQLRAGHAEFDVLRLVKSDTDGYDVELIPAIARTWADSAPVLFFEYDLRLSRVAGNDPTKVWAALAGLGYTDVGVWDNFGEVIGLKRVDEMVEFSAVLDSAAQDSYWDVAVVHGADQPGLVALKILVAGR